jgi:murein DD-endopeptidase MepM/ murein hydrolase activator NlpD
MAFVMIATGANSRSRVRTLPVRPLIALAGVAALALLASGGVVGYWLADAPVRQTSAASTAPDPVVLPFTLEQVGAISARLFRLESEAAQLGKRIGVMNADVPSAVRSHSARNGKAQAEPSGAAGGPLLPQRSETSPLGDIDEQLGRVEQQISSLASAAAEQSLALMRLPTRLPIPGAELTSSFGNRIDPLVHSHAFHAGLDFAARAGTPIVSAAGGIVAFAGFKRDFGWVVEIDHGNGLATRYAHASQLLVRTGEVVVPGDRIAMVGSSGRSTGAHLHFEVLRSGDHVDPRRYLAGM